MSQLLGSTVFDGFTGYIGLCRKYIDLNHVEICNFRRNWTLLQFLVSKLCKLSDTPLSRTFVYIVISNILVFNSRTANTEKLTKSKIPINDFLKTDIVFASFFVLNYNSKYTRYL